MASSGAEGPSGPNDAASEASGNIVQSGKLAGVLVAAGSGSRFGSAKQFEMLGDKRIVEWSYDSLAAVVDRVVVVLPAGSIWKPEPDVITVTGGDTRSDSVRAGLAALDDDVDIVLIHDAARPFATPELGNAVAKAVRDGADSAIPGIAVADTLKRVDEHGNVIETVDRSTLSAVQTPQAFRVDVLRKAHADEPHASDDAALVEQAGGKVVVVPGDPQNLKITVGIDLATARAIVSMRATPSV